LGPGIAPAPALLADPGRCLLFSRGIVVMKPNLLLPVSVISAVFAVACARPAAQSEAPQRETNTAVIAATAGVHDDDVKAAEAAAAPDKKSDAPKPATETTGKSRPHQSPGQSPGQSPHQSPHQSSADTDDDDVISGVTIKSITYAGTACPDGTVASNIAPDAKAFTLLFDSWFLGAGPAVPGAPVTTHLSCQIGITMQAPAGWQVSLLTVDYRGFADLAAGDEARIKSLFRFAGSSVQDSFTAIVQGPYADNFQARSETLLKTATWSSCDGEEKTLHLDVASTITATTDAGASLSLDAVDGELIYKTGLVWRRCRP
jgi:hypothetical protein